MKGQLDINTLVLLLIGVLALINTYYSRKTEKNTNSMREQLVQRTGEASHAAGKLEGKAEAAITAATLAEGRLSATEEKK